MNKDKLKKAEERIFGSFVEVDFNATPCIGQPFYTCNNTKLHKDGSFAEQQWYTFVYLGTDRKIIRLKVIYDFLKDNKREFSRSDILELPLNSEKQSLFEPRYLIEIRKDFIVTLADDFGHINIIAKDRM